MDFIVRLVFFCLVITNLAVGEGEGKLWSVDLSNDPDFAKRTQAPEVLLRPPTIDFLNEDKIIVAFDDGAMSLPAPKIVPFGFHVLEVQATTGAFGTKLSSQVLVNTAQAQPIGDGEFIVLAVEELTRYSASFKKLASFPTPSALHGEPTEQPTARGAFLEPAPRKLANGCSPRRTNYNSLPYKTSTPDGTELATGKRFHRHLHGAKRPLNPTGNVSWE
jgi:hypothetical protein